MCDGVFAGVVRSSSCLPIGPMAREWITADGPLSDGVLHMYPRVASAYALAHTVPHPTSGRLGEA